MAMLGRGKLLRLLVDAAAFPLVAAFLFAFGLLASVVHLIAMPGLFLWEKVRDARLDRQLRASRGQEAK